MKKEKSYTNVIKREIEYRWEINDISSYLNCPPENPDKSTSLHSPEFSTGSQMGDKWKLNLKLNNSDSAEDKDYISLYLNLYNRKKGIKTSYTFFYFNNLGEAVKVGTFEYVFSSGYGSGYGFGDFLAKKKLLENKNTIIPNDTLTAGIQLIVFEPPVTSSNDLDDEPSCMLADAYEKLCVYHPETSDIILKVENHELKAHKAVLLARCPLFAEMFSIITATKEEPIIIPDVDSFVLSEFLEYIYTDNPFNLDLSAEDLLQLAAKYKIQGLKEICVKSLYIKLNISNALRLLALAKECDVPELIELISEFIVINAEQFINNSDYQSFQKSNPTIGLLLFKKFASSRVNGKLKLKN